MFAGRARHGKRLGINKEIGRALLSRRCGNSAAFFLAQQPPLGQGHLIQVVSRSHTTTHHRR